MLLRSGLPLTSTVRFSEYLARMQCHIGWVCGVAGDGAPVGGFVRLGIFSDSPRLGGCGCGGVECLVPLGGLEVELASGEQDGSRSCAYGVCGLRAARGRQVAYGLVIGCGFYAAVEVYMAII